MTKYLLSFFFMLILGVSVFAQDEKPDLYVIAKSGLKLRDAPSLTANPLQTVASGEKVKWISTDYKKTFTVEGITGYMAKVNYAGKTGYMFDGFLAINSPSNPLIINQKMVIIKQTDALELAQMVGTMPQEDLAEAGSDVGYYRMMATDALDKYKVPYLSTEMRFIQFTKEDGTKEIIDTYQTREFDCFLFNGNAVKKINTVDFSAVEEGKSPEFLSFMK